MSVSRFLSLIVFGLYFIVFFSPYQERSSVENFRMVFGFLGFNALCLACIWFPDKMGGLVIGRITSTSPGCFVAFMGWVVFLLPVLGFIIYKIIYKYVL